MEVAEVHVLPTEAWRARAAAHAARVDRYLAPHLSRREARVKHPVFDFLFTYYSYRPAQLRRWHPGYGVRLADAEEYADLKGYGRLDTPSPGGSGYSTTASVPAGPRRSGQSACRVSSSARR